MEPQIGDQVKLEHRQPLTVRLGKKWSRVIANLDDLDICKTCNHKKWEHGGWSMNGYWYTSGCLSEVGCACVEFTKI